ncbi:exodeoxyribonuclease VII large subunit [Helicobacter sp. 11S02596-1]|nr:exodeoxyribonuclease VII large subunit [Helicobacter sp. 11S02596-1]
MLSVSQINSQIKSLVETTFLDVAVEGEISNLTKHSSGHIYFSIKDENSSIRCVLFRGNASRVRFELSNAQKVIVSGGLSVYVPKGEYQIIAKSLEPSGVGALGLAYEQLKNKLAQKGYFDTDKKKKLPLFPKKIALLTSSTGAALQDMKRVAQNRWQLSTLVCINTLVQGDEAKNDIARNIAYADSFAGTKDAFDVIVIARGGGSMEDLWAFNEEIVADAIFAAKTPIVSAVGHEIDFVISDFVADLRAPTPSACMEMILPDGREWLLRLDEARGTMEAKMADLLRTAGEKIAHLRDDFKQVSYEVRFDRNAKEILELRDYFFKSFQNLLDFKSQALESLGLDSAMEYFLGAKDRKIKENKLLLEAKNPKNFIASGYAQIVREGKIADLASLQEDDSFEVWNAEVCLNAKVLEVHRVGK